MSLELADITTLLHIGAYGLIVIGIAGMVLNTNLVKIVFGLAVLEAGANLLLLLATFDAAASAPVLIDGVAPALMADPVPQALVLTAIVIGVGVLALALAIVVRVHAAYRTLDIRILRQRMEQDISHASAVDLPYSHDRPDSVAQQESP